ncbi:MAG TPA: hypothetical protein PK911_05220 [Candidatus Saccharibacteria bacterium]|nr:hypothetical protein [Candidatus Saccharibacteria bacterium]
MDIGAIVNQFGLPVGLLLYFIWQNYQINREYNAYIKDIANKAILAIDKSTEVDTKMLAVAERMEKRLNDERRTN